MGPLLVGTILLSPIAFPIYLVLREVAGRRSTRDHGVPHADPIAA